MAAVPPFFQAEDFFSIAASDDATTIAEEADNPDPNIYKTASLYIGTAGTVNCVSPSGKTKVFTTTVDGTFLPIVVKQVLDTNTSATNILALVAKKRSL